MNIEQGENSILGNHQEVSVYIIYTERNTFWKID